MRLPSPLSLLWVVWGWTLLHLFCTSVGCHRHYLVKRREAWQRIPCWRWQGREHSPVSLRLWLEMNPKYHRCQELWPSFRLVINSAVNFLGQPNFSGICHSPSLQTVSNALVKSMNVMKRLSYCSWHFSCSWRAAKIMSTVPRPPRKQHWLYGSRPCSKWTIRRLSSIRANIFPSMARRGFPL